MDEAEQRQARADLERASRDATRRQVKINKAVQALDSLLYRMGSEETEVKKFARQIQKDLRQ